MTCLGCTVRCEATVCIDLDVIWFLSTKENFEQLETQMRAKFGGRFAAKSGIAQDATRQLRSV